MGRRGKSIQIQDHGLQPELRQCHSFGALTCIIHIELTSAVPTHSNPVKWEAFTEQRNEQKIILQPSNPMGEFGRRVGPALTTPAA